MSLDGGNASDVGEELALATRAAWLYHAGGLTQSQVAHALGIPSVKAHRLIARATRAGYVRVFVDGPIGGCIDCETALVARYGLRLCRVVPSLGESGLPLRALGTAGAGFLRGALDRGEHRVIGLGHGRTLAAAIDHMPRLPAPGVRLVSLLGGLPRRTGSTSFDVMHQLAEKTEADAYMLPVPFFANTPADRSVLLAQRGVAESLELAREATLCLVGIGNIEGDAFLPATGMISAEETASLIAAGASGELLGRYLDRLGRLVATSLHDRVIALPLAAMDGREVVALAGGPDKTDAIHAVLQARLLTGLITDEPTARRLLAQDCSPAEQGTGKCTRKPETSATPSSRAALAGAS